MISFSLTEHFACSQNRFSFLKRALALDMRVLTSFDSYLYFSAYTKNDGRELWRTKGNSEEVWLVSPGATPAGISDTDVAMHGASQDKGINPGILDSDQVRAERAEGQVSLIRDSGGPHQGKTSPIKICVESYAG